jgi:uncharacterized membrane protein
MTSGLPLAVLDSSAKAADGAYGAPLLVLALVLLGSLLVIGRGQGVKCLLMLTAVPALLLFLGWLLVCQHAPLLPVLLIAGALALVGQVFLLVGVGVTGRRAALGAAGGYFCAVLIAWLCVAPLHITGVYSSLLRDLWYAPGTGHLDFRQLAMGTIALAGVGIIADLAVAVTATIQEVHQANPTLSHRALFRAGLRFGRDVIGTEINTLPFALLSTGLGGILLALARPDIRQWPYHWMDWSNRQGTAMEMVAIGAGTIGLALTIPLTAALVAQRLGQRTRAADRPAEGTTLRALRGLRGENGYFRFLTNVKRTLAAGLLFLGVVVLVAVSYDFLGEASFQYPATTGGTRTSLVRGEVLSIQAATGRASETPPARTEAMQTVSVRTAAHRELAVENALTGSPVNDRVVVPGDRVVVRLQETASEQYAFLSEIERDRRLLLLVVAVCAVVVLVSGRQGWRALGALAASLGLMGGLLWLVVHTRLPILPLTLLCAFAVAAVTFRILCGYSRKALGAGLGVVLGLSVAALAAMLFGRWMGLSGRHDGDLMALAFYASAHPFDFPALLNASVLLGAIGVSTDVSIAVASAVAEVSRANPLLGFRALLAAGMSVGRKVIVAMFGAIFFAVAAMNIALFLLPWTMTGPRWQVLHSESVATELFRLLIGGLAIAWCVPAAALCTAWITTWRKSVATAAGGLP